VGPVAIHGDPALAEEAQAGAAAHSRLHGRAGADRQRGSRDRGRGGYPMSALLEVKDLRLQFGGVKAVDGLSFTVDSGEILAVIGPNGAGKTSAFNCISGFYLPTSGSVVFDGKDIVRQAPPVLRTLRLVDLLQSFGFYRVLPS